MEDRERVIIGLVMDAIADDYKEPIHVCDLVNRWAPGGISASPEEILEALQGLINAGLAKAYRLSTQAPAEEIVGFPDSLDSCYFWLTEAGRQMNLKSN